MSTDVINDIPEDPAPRRGLGAVVGGLLSRALFGDPERHAKETLARFAAIKGGQELLDRAKKNGVEIIIDKKRGHEDGYVSYDRKTGKTHVFIANNGKSVDMVMTLWHELRHVCQIAEEKRLHQPMHIFGRDLALRHFHMKMHEADAFTSEIMMALREKKAGHPEYYEAFLKKSREPSSVHSQARTYLHRNRPESFGSEEALARGLFTHIMLHGLTPYGPSRLIHHVSILRGVESVEQLQKLLDEAPALARMPKDMPYDAGFVSLYGRDFMSGVSMRALSTAFRKGEVPQERDILKDMDRLLGEAAKMDDQTFRDQRDAVIGKARAYYTDEDPMPRCWDTQADAFEKELVKSAIAKKPPLMAEFAKAVKGHARKKAAHGLPVVNRQMDR